MKYLKLYEDHNDYYQKISVGEYQEAHSNLENFSEEEISYLKSLTKSTVLVFDPYSIRLYNIKDIFKNNIEVDITKLKDEWYIMEIYPKGYIGRFTDERKIYKCDQLEGLVKSLRDAMQTLLK